MSATDRIYHPHKIILPTLEKGKAVICDCYVYVAFGLFIHRGIDSRFIGEINKGLLRPDYTFYLNVPAERLIQRLNRRDGANLKYGERYIKRILSIISTYEKMGDHLIDIDGNKEIDLITRSVVQHINFEHVGGNKEDIEIG